MRTTWKPLSNETKRDDSVELSRFFVLRRRVMKTKLIIDMTVQTFFIVTSIRGVKVE